MTNTDQRKRPLIFGEVLFDIFPDGSEVLGGAPFNLAWHLHAYGQAPLLVSRVGNDALGRSIRASMQSREMDTRGLQMDSAHPTGVVRIELENDEPRFHILPDQAYDFIDATALPPGGASPLLYHGTLALRNAVSRRSLETLKGDMAAVFLDVNLRDPWWERSLVLELLRDARWIKLNEAELEALAPAGEDQDTRAQALRESSGAEVLFVTRGGKGALAVTASGQVATVEPGPAISVVDTVGAGDAFASVLVLGLLRDWELETILERAQAFASAIVGIRGATTSDEAFYEPFLKRWSLA